MSTPINPLPQFGQSAIQETVHFFDLGVGQRIIRGVLMTIAAGLLLLVYGGNQFRGLNQPEAMDQAQLARNLARGEGYTTQFIRPMSMWQISERSRWRDPMGMMDKHPDLMNPPGYPAALAGLFFLVQKGDIPCPTDPPKASFASKKCEPLSAKKIVQTILRQKYLAPAFFASAAAWIGILIWRLWRARTALHSVPLHIPGICILLILGGLFWAPKTSFEVDVEAGFAMFGPDRWVVYGFGIPIMLLNGVLTYLIGRRLFDRRVGATAAALFILSETICQYAISGLNIGLLMTWVSLSWLTMLIVQDWREKGSRPVAAVIMALLAAGLVGAAFLTRYSAGWLLLPLCVFGWRLWGWARGRWMAAGMIAVFLVVTGPWMARNFWMSSNFLGLASYRALEGVDAMSGERLERMLEPNFAPITYKRLALKAAANAHAVWTDSPWVLGGGLILVLFTAALLHRFRRPEVNRFKWFIVGCGGVLFLATVIIGTSPRPDKSLAQVGNLLVLLTPVAACFGAALFYTFLDRMQIHIPIWRGCVIALFIFASAAPVFLRMVGPASQAYAYPPYFPPKVAEAAHYLEPKELMMSDQPWSVAWYGDRRCLWMTFTPEEFYKINDLRQHVSGMLLTPVTLNRRFLSDIMFGEWMNWAPILRFLKFPEDFPLKFGKQLEGVNIVLVCDRKRWKDDNKPAGL